MSQKCILPHLPNAIFPADETTSRPGMASYRKSLLTSQIVMEMCQVPVSWTLNINAQDANYLFAINAQCLKKTRTLKDGQAVKALHCETKA